MIKKGYVFFALGLFVILACVVAVSAATEDTFIQGWFDFWKLWDQGPDSVLDYGLLGGVAKYLFLGMIIIMVYSALTFASFPEGATLRFALSVIVGLLSTILISQSEIIASLQSYNALGTALILFFPILVLSFFTIVVVKKSRGIGLFSQRLIWLIFSVWLFLRTGFILLLKAIGDSSIGGIPILDVSTTSGKIVSFFFGSLSNALLAAQSDNTWILVQFILSIAVFFIFVAGNKNIVHWLAKEITESEAEARKTNLKRSEEFVKENAEAMQKA